MIIANVLGETVTMFSIEKNGNLISAFNADIYERGFVNDDYNRIDIINVKLPIDKSVNKNFSRMLKLEEM